MLLNAPAPSILQGRGRVAAQKQQLKITPKRCNEITWLCIRIFGSAYTLFSTDPPPKIHTWLFFSLFSFFFKTFRVFFYQSWISILCY
jgi:hypothetical protein